MKGGARVVGYHGTSRKHARNILRRGFKPSGNDWDWLGRGIYFFEEDLERAQEWAREHHVDDPAVIAAVIDLGGVLDLNQRGTLDQLQLAAKQLEASYHSAGQTLPNNRGQRRMFDNLLINYFCNKAASAHVYPVVRGLFEEGPPIHAASAFRRLTHVQLAVRDPRAILGLWRIDV